MSTCDASAVVAAEDPREGAAPLGSNPRVFQSRNPQMSLACGFVCRSHRLRKTHPSSVGSLERQVDDTCVVCRGGRIAGLPFSVLLERATIKGFSRPHCFGGVSTQGMKRAACQRSGTSRRTTPIFCLSPLAGSRRLDYTSSMLNPPES